MFEEWDQSPQRVNRADIVKGKKRISSIRPIPSSYFSALYQQEIREKDKMEKRTSCPSVADRRIVEDKTPISKNELDYSSAPSFSKVCGIKDAGVLLGRICLSAWAIATVSTLIIANGGNKGLGLIACLVVLFFGWTFCSDWLFASDEKKVKLAKKRDKEKRWGLVCDDRIPFGEMSWSEQIYYVYHHKDCGRSFADLIFKYQDKIVREQVSEEDEEFVTDHLVRRYVEDWLKDQVYSDTLSSFANPLEFVSRYSRIINELGCFTLNSIVGAAYKQPIAVRIEMYKQCLAVCDKEWLRKEYLYSIHSLEERAKREDREIRRRELAARLKAHKDDIEHRGGFKDVASGTDYEIFVEFCLREAGAVAKRVGQSGDYGADVVADCGRGGRVVIQCKFYSSTVGYEAVKEVFTAKTIYKGKYAWVVSNAGYTNQAKVAARKLGVKLLSHEDVTDEVMRVMCGDVRSRE